MSKCKLRKCCGDIDEQLVALDPHISSVSTPRSAGSWKHHWPGRGCFSSTSLSKHPPSVNPSEEPLLFEMEGCQSADTSEKFKVAAQHLLMSSHLVRSCFQILEAGNNWDLIHQSIRLTVQTACQSFWKKISQVSRTAGGEGGEMVFPSLDL